MYKYLSISFKDLFNHDGSIWNFNIWCGLYSMCEDYYTINDVYGGDIHDAILPWIHEEYRSGRLLKKDLWNHFHDPMYYTSVFCGYRKLFIF